MFSARRRAGLGGQERSRRARSITRETPAKSRAANQAGLDRRPTIVLDVARSRALPRPASRTEPVHVAALSALAFAKMRAPECRSAARSLGTSSERAVDRSAHACLASGKRERDLVSARRSSLVRCDSLAMVSAGCGGSTEPAWPIGQDGPV